MSAEYEALKQSLSTVSLSLGRVTRVFEERLKELQEAGGDPETLKSADEAVNAMRDSAAIFMAWAYHYTGVPQDQNGG